MTTNTDRIIQTLRRWPGLDDDALGRQADVHPRQQVNQICRRLEQRGLLRRIIGVSGKIGNILTLTRDEAATNAVPATVELKRPAPVPPPRLPIVSYASRSHTTDLVSDPSSTLFIIPCSGAKGSQPKSQRAGPSLLDALSPAIAHRLKDARGAMRARAHVDETTMVPAWQRYRGALYRAAHQSLLDIQDRGLDMLIVSGRYGLVLAGEPIGIYNSSFSLSSWPRGLLEEVLIDYVGRRNLTSVRAITSATGDYRKLLTHVRWGTAGILDAILLSPQARAGAMVLSPRAQGETLTALLRGSVDFGWSSSDGLKVDAHRMA
jgi:hypothetical protein